MQKTSDTYKSIMRGRHWFECKVVISGNTFEQNDIFSMKISRQLFNGEYPTIGSCVSAEIDLVIKKPNVTIPRNAVIAPYYRVTNGTASSEWIPKGIFWIDTRQETKNPYGVDTLTIHGYDDMLKLSQKVANFNSIKILTFLSKLFNDGIVLQLDSLAFYSYPDLDRVRNGVIYDCKGKTYREILSAIGMKLCVNFVIDEISEGVDTPIYGLTFIPFEPIAPEANSFLIDESGNYILVGGDRIIV